MTTFPELSLPAEQLSPWWRRSVYATMIIGFTVLILLTIKVHHDAPPIPGKVVDPSDELIFSKQDILHGQEVFLEHGLMDNGSIWGHGGYLGPDFSAQYLHTLAVHAAETLSSRRFNQPVDELTAEQHIMIEYLVRSELKENRYDADSDTLI